MNSKPNPEDRLSERLAGQFTPRERDLVYDLAARQMRTAASIVRVAVVQFIERETGEQLPRPALRERRS